MRVLACDQDDCGWEGLAEDLPAYRATDGGELRYCPDCGTLVEWAAPEWATLTQWSARAQRGL